jgi:DNA polymerase I-like protein with 3'-5' exonuclease and polymerase domains
MILSLDTETTGLDLYHGACPFLVTLCDEDGNNTWWQWNVEPTTRKVNAPAGDLREINDLLAKADALILQNAKFDYQGLRVLMDGKEGRPKLWWDWGKVYDTLLAGHLLASNQPHDLTTMALVYLGVNVQPFEDAMKAACTEARKYIKKWLPNWRLAKVGEPDMPSAKESTWKYDTWMLKQLAEADESVSRDWLTVTGDYANSDSLVTMRLFLKQRELLKERHLWKIYKERLKLLPVISTMERRGVSICKERACELETQYTESSSARHRLCLNISEGKLDKLPKNGSSNALKSLLFDTFALKTDKKTKKGNVSLDKHVIEEWMDIIPHQTKPYLFLRALQGYRKRQTALGYIASYKKFWIPTEEEGWCILHPSINPTGTATLRMSSSNPNEQQISKAKIAELGEKGGHNARYMFGPMPGREWWSLDAKNIELRLPAYESEERELISLFERPDDPPYYGSVHLLNFHTVYPDIWDKAVQRVGIEKAGPYCKEEYDSSWYQWCKNGDFAVQYGAIERTDVTGTADRAFHRVGSHAKLKKRFGKLEKLNKKWIAFAEKRGYVETIPDKTVDSKRGYPLFCSRTSRGGILPTVPLNYHIQGSAMWWMCKAMVRCHNYLQDYNRSRKPEYHAHLVMQIHDELVFDFPKSSIDPRGLDKSDRFKSLRTHVGTVKAIQALMQQGGDDYDIPTPVSIKYHPDSWGEGFSIV